MAWMVVPTTGITLHKRNPHVKVVGDLEIRKNTILTFRNKLDLDASGSVHVDVTLSPSEHSQTL